MDPLSDLIRALDRAESRPGYEFVALKWFRDTVLPAEGFPWASYHSARQTVLRDAIDKRLILTSKMPNPRSPQFPVTAIRLNRLVPEVMGILGSPEGDGALEMIDRYALRAYEAVQLAGCLALKGAGGMEVPTFVCSDQQLLKAARSELFPILDPCAPR